MERAEEFFEKIKSEGKSAIKEFILTRKEEELFLDFKRSADNGNGELLHTTDRKNLQKAISGYEMSDRRAKLVVKGRKMGTRGAFQQHHIPELSQHVDLLSGGSSVGGGSNKTTCGEFWGCWCPCSELESITFNNSTLILKLGFELIGCL